MLYSKYPVVKSVQIFYHVPMRSTPTMHMHNVTTTNYNTDEKKATKKRYTKSDGESSVKAQ